MPADTSVTIFPLDHPRLSRTLKGKLEQRRIELMAQLANGNAEDWPDYKERVGAIRGLEQAIAIAAEIEKDLEHH